MRTCDSRAEASDIRDVTRLYSASSRGSGCSPPNESMVAPTADSLSCATTCWYFPGTLCCASSRSRSATVATSLETDCRDWCAWSDQDVWSGACGAQPDARATLAHP